MNPIILFEMTFGQLMLNLNKLITLKIDNKI